MKKILVTSILSKTGESVVNSLYLANKYIVVGCDNNRSKTAYHHCSNFFQVPFVLSSDYVDSIVELCVKENIDLVIPSLESELSLFSKAIDLFNSKGIEVIISKSYISFEKTSTSIEQENLTHLSEISIQLIFTKESDLAGMFISKNIFRNNILVYIEPIKKDEFEYIDEVYRYVQLCKDEKLVGPVNFQCRETSEGLVYIGIKMHFTDQTDTRALLGFNEVEFLVENFLGNDAKLGVIAYNKVGLKKFANRIIPRKDISRKTFLILGAGGFVGSEFVAQILNDNLVAHLYLICRESSFEKYLEVFVDKKITIIKENDVLLPSYLACSDYVINFASALNFMPQEEMFKAINFQYKLTKLLMFANTSTIINISSQSVYDQSDNVYKDENANIELNTLYSFQKYIAEEFFKTIAENNPATQVVSLRSSRVFGVNNRGAITGGFFAKIIENTINRKSYSIAAPNNNSTLIDVKDVANAIIFILKESEVNKALPRTINLGGESLSMREFCVKVETALKVQESFAIYGCASGVERSSMISSELIYALGWKPTYTIEETIKTIANVILKNKQLK